ncbi:MAG: hypothetical protein IPN69_14810 [Acidobacteria bacterium]|nr:hypothetical protein [Acidobacteriota bacterium]
MRQTIDAFLDAVSGKNRENIKVDDTSLQIAGGSDLVAFVGHNGLMDFKLDRQIENSMGLVAMRSFSLARVGSYFSNRSKMPVQLRFWTTYLMAPEAYISARRARRLG